MTGTRATRPGGGGQHDRGRAVDLVPGGGAASRSPPSSPTKSGCCSCCSCCAIPGCGSCSSSSTAVDPATIDYYLRFLPDPEDARPAPRILVALGDPSIGSLSAKLLRGRPTSTGCGRPGRPTYRRAPACCPSTSPRPRQQLADALGIPLYGPRPDLVWLGSKSGSRQVAMEAGVPILPGAEDVFSLAELAKAIAEPAGSPPRGGGGRGQAQQRVRGPGQRHHRARRPGRSA